MNWIQHFRNDNTDQIAISFRIVEDKSPFSVTNKWDQSILNVSSQSNPRKTKFHSNMTKYISSSFYLFYNKAPTPQYTTIKANDRATIVLTR